MELLIVLGICLIVVLGAALPLLKARDDKHTLPPKKETLKSFRDGL